MRIVFLFIAIAISAAAAFIAYNMMVGSPSQQDASLVVQPQVVEKQIPTQDVYVARGEIKVGDMIQQDMLDRQPWPKHLIGPGFVKAGNDAPKLIGMVARTPFSPGEVVLDTKLANPADPSFLAASIPDGTRAITISVNAISGVAGLIFPGDRVDVLMTHSLYSKKTNEFEKRQVLDEAMDEILDIQDNVDTKEQQQTITDRLQVINAKVGVVEQKAKMEEPVTEIIVPDVRVLAVNQRVILTGNEEKKEPPQTVTIEVKKEDAQRLKLAEREGALSLALRSLHDKSAELIDPLADGDLSRTIPPGYFPKLYGFDSEYPKELLVKKKRIRKNAKENKITVVRGVTVEEIEFERPEASK
jgi:pilus assembly protein CpaB